MRCEPVFGRAQPILDILENDVVWMKDKAIPSRNVEEISMDGFMTP